MKTHATEDIDKMLKVAASYRDGSNDFEKNDVEALKWYMKIAELREVEERYWYDERVGSALFNIGYFYENGLGGLQQNYREARNWYVDAENRDNTDAMYRLGIFYENGLGGLKKNKREARNWYSRAVHINGTYETEWEPSKAFPAAIACIQNAAEGGDMDAMYDMGCFYHNAFGGLERDDVEALTWFQKAADEGQFEAMFYIGSFYCEGLGGLEQNETEALTWFWKAAEAGSSDAMYWIGEFYLSGSGGLEKDEEKALEWYEKAAEEHHFVAQLSAVALRQELGKEKTHENTKQ